MADEIQIVVVRDESPRIIAQGDEGAVIVQNVQQHVQAVGGALGARGQAANTWHSGSGAPSDLVGIDGDFYLDTSNGSFWGPKLGGTWTGTGPTLFVADHQALLNRSVSDAHSQYHLSSLGVLFGVVAGTEFVSYGPLVFGDDGGVTFGLDNSTITGSYTQSTHSHSTAPGAISAGTESATSGTIVFGDSNGVSFGMSDSTITASYTQSTHSHSTAPGAISAGTESATSGTIVFGDSNGVSFGMSDSTITASYTQSTHSHSTAPGAISAGTESATSGTIVFGNSNGVSFGMSDSTITASYTFSNQAASASNGSSTFETISFGNANGVSFQFSNGSVVASYVPALFSAGTQTTSGQLIFGNSNGVSFGLTSGTLTGSVASLFDASQVTISSIGTPTYDDLRDMHDLTRSAGHLDGGEITDAGGGDIDVAAGSGLIRAMADDTSTLFSFDWPATPGLTIPTDTIRYVVVEYNGGSPQVVLYTSESYDYRDAFPLGFVVNEGGTLYINDTPHSTGRSAGRLARRNYEVDGRSRANALGGLILDETGTLNVGVSAGVTWLRGIREVVAAFDSSGSDTFDRYYRDGGGGFTKETAQSAIPSGLYDDNSGTPQLISNNNFAVYWMYMGPASVFALVYGRAQYANLAAASASMPPGDVPLRLQVGSILLGRFIVQRTAGPTYTVVQVDSAFSADFIPAPVTDHGALAGLADDDHPQYWQSSLGVVPGLVAGTQANSGVISFSDANGVSFGLDNGTMTASISPAGGGLTAINVSAGTTSNNLSALTFGNGNGISFGLDASTITASHNGLTTAALSDHSHGATAANGGFNFQTISFSNANGISFGTSAGSAITASHNALTTAAASDHSHGNPTLALTNLTGTTASNSAGFTLSLSGNVAPTPETPFGISAGTQSVSTGTLVFSNSNGITFGMSGSSRITASHDGLTSQSNQNVTAGNGGFAFQTLSFSNVNGISFGTSAGSAITASHNALTTAALSNHSHGASASNGSFAFQTLNFSNANNVTFGTSAGGIVTASVAAAGAASVNFSAGTTSNNLGTIVFSNSNGVSFGLNGSTMTASVNAAGGGLTYSGWEPYRDNEVVGGQQGQGTLHLNPVRLENPRQFDRIALPIINTNSSNSSGSHTLSFWAGVYTRNGSTLSLAGSASGSTNVTHSGTLGSYSLFSGQRLFTIPWTSTLTEGPYWIGILSRTTSGGANGSYSQLVLSNIGSNFLGHFGSSHNTTYQYTLGQGVYTATTSGMPNSIAFSQIRGSDSLARRSPVIQFISGTI